MERRGDRARDQERRRPRRPAALLAGQRHFSNWDEEDIRSIVAYLRLLPPVAEKVPPNRPPAADDCKVYTFWVHKTQEPGCKG